MSNGTAPASPAHLGTDSHPFVQLEGFVNGSWWVFLVAACASSVLGGMFARRLSLPLLTGYMVAGVCFGPRVLDIVKAQHIPDLAYVTQTALAFIAFSAGSELYLPELRSLFKVIAWVSAGTTAVTYLGCSFLVFALSSTSVTPWMRDFDSSCRLMISLLIGSIMVARSPASAIAVVRELHAHGKLTSTSLGVTVVADVLVLVLFTLSSSLALAVCGGDGFHGAEFLITILTLASAVVIGYGFGYLLILLLWIRVPRFPWVSTVARYSILPLGLLCFMLCDWFELYSAREWGVAINFDALLICIAAGYVVTNQSRNRIEFMSMLGSLSALVFIPFFTKVGVELNLQTLWQSIGLAVILFLARALTMCLGGWGGGAYAGLSSEHARTVWLTMLSQAGVSLGLASQAAQKFGRGSGAGGFGPDLQTAIVGVVVLNTLIGPSTAKYALKRAGETHATEEEAEEARGKAAKMHQQQHQHHRVGGEEEGDEPELELSFDPDDEAAGMENGNIGGDGVRSPGGGVPRRRGMPSTGASSARHGTPGGMASSSSSSSVQPRTLINVHGSRLTLVTRRALLLGVDALTMSLACRLLDTGEWSVIVLEESMEKCARAQAMLGQRAREQARQAAQAETGYFTPLSRGLAWLKRLPDTAAEGLEAGLDAILPPNHADPVHHNLMGGSNGQNGDGGGHSGGGTPVAGSSDFDARRGGGGRASRKSSLSSSAHASSRAGPRSSSIEDDEGATGGGGGAIGVRHKGDYGELKEQEEEVVIGLDEDAIRDVPLGPPSSSATGIGPSSISLRVNTESGSSSVGGRPASPSMRASPDLYAPHNPLTAASPRGLPLGHTPAASAGSAAGGLAARVYVHRLRTDGYRTFLDAYQSVEEELFLTSSSGEGVDAALMALPIDAVTHDLARHLAERRRMADRVYARVKNPAWAPVLGSMGVVPLYGPSVEAQLLSQMLAGAPFADESTASFSSHRSTVPFASSSLIGLSSSDLVASSVHADDDLSCALLDLDNHARSEYTRAHPPPPAHLLASAAALTAQARMSRPHLLAVVSDAQRHTYMDAIASMRFGFTRDDSAAGGSPTDADAFDTVVDTGMPVMGLSALRYKQHGQRQHAQQRQKQQQQQQQHEQGGNASSSADAQRQRADSSLPTRPGASATSPAGAHIRDIEPPL